MSAVARSNFNDLKASSRMKVEGTALKNGGGDVRFQNVYSALNPPTGAPNSLPFFSYIVVTTKVLSDMKPTILECLEPYVKQRDTTIVLIQNGVGIEDEVQARWPENLVLSGVVSHSYAGSLQR